MKLLSTRKLAMMNGVTLLLCAVSIQFVNGSFFYIPQTGYQDYSDSIPETEYHAPVSAPTSDGDDYFLPTPSYPTGQKPAPKPAKKPGKKPAQKPIAQKPYNPPVNKPTAPTPSGFKPYTPPTFFFEKPTPRPTMNPTFQPTERPTPVPTPRPTVSVIKVEII